MDDTTKSTWLKVGKRYKCGNCGFMPVSVDIRDWKQCLKCGRTMEWYEDEGVLKSLVREGEKTIVGYGSKGRWLNYDYPGRE